MSAPCRGAAHNPTLCSRGMLVLWGMLGLRYGASVLPCANVRFDCGQPSPSGALRRQMQHGMSGLPRRADVLGVVFLLPFGRARTSPRDVAAHMRRERCVPGRSRGRELYVGKPRWSPARRLLQEMRHRAGKRRRPRVQSDGATRSRPRYQTTAPSPGCLPSRRAPLEAPAACRAEVTPHQAPARGGGCLPRRRAPPRRVALVAYYSR